MRYEYSDFEDAEIAVTSTAMVGSRKTDTVLLMPAAETMENQRKAEDEGPRREDLGVQGLGFRVWGLGSGEKGRSLCQTTFFDDRIPEELHKAIATEATIQHRFLVEVNQGLLQGSW